MRIAHFTDLHFTRPPADFPLRDLLFSKRGVGWLNLTVKGRYRRFIEMRQVVAAFLADIEDQQLDLIVFTGDLTAVAYQDEFAAAAAALAPLCERDDVVGLPGNHDLYTRKAGGEALFTHFFPRWCRSDRPELMGAGQRYPVVRHLGDDAILIAISGARPTLVHDSSGKLGATQIASLEALLSDPDVRRRRKILALHYGPRRADGRPDKKHHGLRDTELLLELAARHGVALIVHGHLHGRFVLGSGPQTPVPIANAGSLTDERYQRAYHIYQLGQDAIELEVRRYDPASASFAAWSSAPGAGALR